MTSPSIQMSSFMGGSVVSGPLSVAGPGPATDNGPLTTDPPMNELIWIDGDVMPLAEARVGVEDRGYQFADGVYEVVRLYDGRPFTLHEHLERLEHSAAGIR